jgi:hypothetical protein
MLSAARTPVLTIFASVAAFDGVIRCPSAHERVEIDVAGIVTGATPHTTGSVNAPVKVRPREPELVARLRRAQRRLQVHGRRDLHDARAERC